MNIGLFFGTFDPVHHGHLMLADYILSTSTLDKIWFVPSPQSPFKTNKKITNIYDRIELLHLAVDDYEGFGISDIELKMPQPSYTIDTLTYLKEKYPHHTFYLLLGADNLIGFAKWKNYEQILENYRLMVYPRKGINQAELISHASIEYIDAPEIEISSSLIRSFCKQKKSIQFFVPLKVAQFIEEKGLYL